MAVFFLNLRRKIATGAMVFAYTGICGCAQSLSTNLPRTIGRSNTPKYRVEINHPDGTRTQMTGRTIEYRLNDVLISVGDGQLRADGKVLTTLKESDIVAIEDSQSIAVNGIRLWPDVSE